MAGQNYHIANFLRHARIFKLYSRNSSVQIAENFAYFCMRELKKLRGLQFKQLMLGRNEFMDVYCRADEFITVEKIIAEKLKQSKTIKQFFERDGLPVFARYTALTNRLHKKYSGRQVTDSATLLRDYQAFAKINAAFIAFNFFIYLSDPVIDRMLIQALSAHVAATGKSDKLQEYLVCIATPLKKPAVVQEHLALLKLIVKNKVSNKKALRAHREKWQWFPCYNPSDDPYAMKHYTEEIKLYTPRSAEQELKKIAAEQTKHARDYARLLRAIKDSNLKKLIAITNSVSYYRERRNDLRRQGLCAVRPLYEAIGNTIGRTVKEVCYLTNSEIQESLRRGVCPVAGQQIRNRFKAYLIFTDLHTNIFSDDKNNIQKTSRVITGREMKQTVVPGTTAVRGLVQGVVRVISSIKVLKDFKTGEILVASMTAPEYVPAMKKAAAIITDEGGITCHAAVISRELVVPCIVGTKIATKVFKDGDMVEVDAERGIVRKLFKS